MSTEIWRKELGLHIEVVRNVLEEEFPHIGLYDFVNVKWGIVEDLLDEYLHLDERDRKLVQLYTRTEGNGNVRGFVRGVEGLGGLWYRDSCPTFKALGKVYFSQISGPLTGDVKPFIDFKQYGREKDRELKGKYAVAEFVLGGYFIDGRKKDQA